MYPGTLGRAVASRRRARSYAAHYRSAPPHATLYRYVHTIQAHHHIRNTMYPATLGRAVASRWTVPVALTRGTNEPKYWFLRDLSTNLVCLPQGARRGRAAEAAGGRGRHHVSEPCPRPPHYLRSLHWTRLWSVDRPIVIHVDYIVLLYCKAGPTRPRDATSAFERRSRHVRETQPTRPRDAWGTSERRIRHAAATCARRDLASIYLGSHFCKSSEFMSFLT